MPTFLQSVQAMANIKVLVQSGNWSIISLEYASLSYLTETSLHLLVYVRYLKW